MRYHSASQATPLKRGSVGLLGIVRNRYLSVVAVVASLAAPRFALGLSKQTVELPAALTPFVAAGTRPIEVVAADLNGDGVKDFLLVLEHATADSDDEGDRELLIIVRQPDGSLVVARRSKGAVPGGDDFQGIQAKPKSFIIETYGGHSWRTSTGSTFTYSRRDRTWQLTRVQISTFHVSNPDQITTHVFHPPGDFGKIDIENFEFDSIFSLGATNE